MQRFSHMLQKNRRHVRTASLGIVARFVHIHDCAVLHGSERTRRITIRKVVEGDVRSSVRHREAVVEKLGKYFPAVGK